MEGGRGPANHGYQGGPPDGFNNEIRYRDMSNYSRVAQYKMMMEARHSEEAARRSNRANYRAYGLGGGDELAYRLERRQQELKASAGRGARARSATGLGLELGFGAAFGTAASTGSYAAASAAGMSGMGAAAVGAAGGIMLPVVAAGWAAGQFGRGINDVMSYRQATARTAMDFDVYRGKLGFTNPLSYGQSTSLAAQVNAMNADGTASGFFSSREMNRIHKLGMASGLTNARGGGVNSGTISQYKTNFKELVSTTEEVVKTLKTTIEGGMSVIRELKNSGFEMSQIKSQIKQISSSSTATGLSTQNVMHLGRAGAQAVQGTGWRASVGANMYQQGAVQAANMMGSPTASYAVNRVGGVAQAGAILANMQMNLLQSGYGTKIAAYAMNNDGSINSGRLNRVVNGQAGAYEVVTGAAQRGYAMGPSGRALFELHKEDFINNITDSQRQSMFRSTFNMWRRNKGGNTRAQAWAFSGQFAGNARERRLAYEALLAPSGFDRGLAATDMNRMTSLYGDIGSKRTLSDLDKFKSGNDLRTLGADAFEAYDEWSSNKGWRNLFLPKGAEKFLDNDYANWKRAGGLKGTASRFFGIADKYETFSSAKIGSAQDAYAKMYGLKRGNLAGIGMDLMARDRARGIDPMAGVNLRQYHAGRGQDLLDMFGYDKMSIRDRRAFEQTISVAQRNNADTKELIHSKDFLRAINAPVGKGRYKWIKGGGLDRDDMVNMVGAMRESKAAKIQTAESNRGELHQTLDAMTPHRREQTIADATRAFDVYKAVTSSSEEMRYGGLKRGASLEQVLFKARYDINQGRRYDKSRGRQKGKMIYDMDFYDNVSDESIELAKQMVLEADVEGGNILESRWDQDAANYGAHQLYKSTFAKANAVNFGTRAQELKHVRKQLKKKLGIDLKRTAGRQAFAELLRKSEGTEYTTLSDKEKRLASLAKSTLGDRFTQAYVDYAEGSAKGQAADFLSSATMNILSRNAGAISAAGGDASFTNALSQIIQGTNSFDTNAWWNRNKRIMSRSGLITDTSMFGSNVSASQIRNALVNTDRTGGKKYDIGTRAVAAMNLKIADLSRAISNTSQGELVKFKDGDNEREMDRLSAQSEVESLKAQVKEATQTPQQQYLPRPTSVQGPVLNYWNNNWMR